MRIAEFDLNLKDINLRRVVVGGGVSALTIIGLSLIGSGGGDVLSVHAQGGNDITPTPPYYLEPGKVYSYCGNMEIPGSIPPGKYCMHGVYVIPGTESQYFSDGVVRPTHTPEPGKTLPSHVRITATATPVVE